MTLSRHHPAALLSRIEAHLLDRLDATPPGGPPDADESIRFVLWIPDRPVACLGLSQKAEREINLDAAAADGVEILRRGSGGGAVLLTPDCLCWEAWAGRAALGKDHGIRPAYTALSRAVSGGLRRLGLDTAPAGISDLACRGAGEGSRRKLAGTAQFRRRDLVWVHGSLLVTAEPRGLSRWLKPPSEAPDYRNGRDHGDFCVTVAELLGRRDGVMAECVQAIRAAAAIADWRESDAATRDTERARRLTATKYGNPDWNLRARRAEQSPASQSTTVAE